jgi:PAS domain S-box-containing protein
VSVRLAADAPAVGLGPAVRGDLDAAAAWQAWAEGRRAAGGGVPDPAQAIEGKRLFDAFRTAQATLESRTGGLLTSTRDAGQAARQRLLLGLVALSLLTAAGLLVFAWSVHRLVIRPTVRLCGIATRLADGEAVSLPHTDRGDEVGELSRALGAWVASRREVDSLFHLSHDILCAIGLDGHFKRLNPAWERALGWTIREMLAVPAIDLVHPDDRRATAEVMAELNEGHDAVAFENRYRCRDGSYRTLAWEARISLSDGLVYAAARDVTERRSEEDRVRAQAALLDLVHDAVFVRSLDDRRISFWNRGASDIYGFTQEEALGREPGELLRTVHTVPLPELERELADTGRWEGELVQTRKDGEHIAVFARWALQLTDTGTPAGILEVNRDVTVRKRAERAIERTMAQQEEIVSRLQALDEAKSNFVSTASHELRTPLASIMAYTELLLDDGGLGEGQLSMLHTIERNAKRLLSLVEDLLNLSRIESGRNEMRLALTDVGAMVTAAVHESETAARARGVELTIHVDRTLPLVQADRSQLDRVLTNLCSNAIKFTPAGGSVTVSASRSRADGGLWAEIRIADTGLGIPREEQVHVFDQFFRASTARRQAIPGTGLGLSIVKGIVEQHRGQVSIESQPGQGTCVTVLLPAGSS